MVAETFMTRLDRYDVDSAYAEFRRAVSIMMDEPKNIEWVEIDFSQSTLAVQGEEVTLRRIVCGVRVLATA